MRSQLGERRDELESLEVMLQLEIDKGSKDLEAQSRQLEILLRQKKALQATHASDLDEERLKVRNIVMQPNHYFRYTNNVLSAASLL